MGIEALIEKLVVALEENTAAHTKLAQVATAAAASNGKSDKSGETKATEEKASKATESKKSEDEDEDDAAAKAAEAKKKAAAERRRKAAEKKAEEAKKAAEKDDEDEDEDLDLDVGDEDDEGLPEVQAEATIKELHAAAAAYLDEDAKDYRDENKKNVVAAFAHLGVKKLGELKADDRAEDRAKLLAYITYWKAGQKVDFEAVDARVAEAGE